MEGGAGSVPLHEGHGADVVDAPVRPDHPELGVEILLAAQGHVDFGIAPLAVIRVKARRPGLISSGELIPRDPVLAIHVVVPDEAVVGNVPVPDADLSRLRGQRQSLGELPQILFRLLPLGDIGDEAVPEHRAVGLALRHRVAVKRAGRAVGKLDPILILPGGQGPRRLQDRLDNALAVVWVEVRKNFRRVVLNLLRRDTVDFFDGLAGKREAGGSIGAQAILVDDPGDAARDFQDAVQQLLAVLFRLLDLRDVEAGSDEPEKNPIRREPGNTMVLKPTEFPIGPPKAVFHLEFPQRLIRQQVGAHAGFEIIGMDVFRPSVSQFLLQRAPGEIEPRLVEGNAQAVRAGLPKQHGRGVSRAAEAPFAFLQ